MGAQTIGKQGQKVLPGVSTNKKGAPKIDQGLQYMPQSNNQSRQNLLLQRVHTMPELVEPQSKIPFESRNYEPVDLLYKIENDKSSKKLLNLGKAAIWAGEAQVGQPKVKQARDQRHLQGKVAEIQSQLKKKESFLFGSIEDVQHEDDADYFEDEVQYSSRPSAYNSQAGLNRESSKTGLTRQTTNKAAHGRQSKTQLGNIKSDLLKSDLSQHQTITPRIENKNNLQINTAQTLDSSKPAPQTTLASRKANENKDFFQSKPQRQPNLSKAQSQFLLRLPIPSGRNQGRQDPARQCDWTSEVQSQLATFRNHQTSQILPDRPVEDAHEVDPRARHLQRMETERAFSNKHPQFSTLNCQPYRREGNKDIGALTVKSNLTAGQQQKMAMGSKTIQSSVVGTQYEKMRTPLGPSDYRQQRPIPSQHTFSRNEHAKGWCSNNAVGSRSLLPSQSQTFLDARENTRDLVERMNSKSQLRDQQETKSSRFANKLRLQAASTRNLPHVGETEHTEQILRKHFFMAQATGRTLAPTLERDQQSPMKHLSSFKGSADEKAVESQTKQLNVTLKKETYTVMWLNRDQTLEKLQIQSSSLMRLNAAWGLEPKPDPLDFFKADLPDRLRNQRSIESGVQYDTKLSQNQFFDDKVGRTLLDRIITLLQTRSNDDGYFLYLKPSESSDPYDLVPLVEMKKPKPSQTQDASQLGQTDPTYQLVDGHMLRDISQTKFGDYYTLSKKGLTHYTSSYPLEYTSLSDWLVERSFYRELTTKSFFQNFRRWKQLRMWRRNILRKKREEVRTTIAEKLFLLDPNFSHIVIQHRLNCESMTHFRVIDMKQRGMETLTLEEFQQKQVDIRAIVQKEIERKSEQTKQMFITGCENVLNQLRKKVQEQEIEDESATRDFANSKKNADDHIASQGQNGQASVSKNPRFEALGFTVTLKYGMRKQLRKACTRFLRFSYLLDFIALDTLSRIYLNSIKDTHGKLRDLSDEEIDFDLVQKKDEDDLDTSHLPASMRANPPPKPSSLISAGGTVPFFHIVGDFNLEDPERHDFYDEYIDQFDTSRSQNFNPVVHLSLEPEEESDEEPDPFGYLLEEDEDPLAGKVQVRRVRNLNKTWLSVSPPAPKFIHAINDALLQGKDVLGKYIRWSRNPMLNKYEKVLESWDDRVASEWTEPDSPYLNCDDWLLGNQTFHNREKVVKRYINEAFGNIKHFFKGFEPILIAFWENNHTDFSLFKNDRLMYQAEVLNALLRRYARQKQYFDDVIPITRDIGMLKLDFKHIRKNILPQPQERLNLLRKTVPQVLQKRVLGVKEWLEEQIRVIKIPPTSVDSYVKQIHAIDYVDDNFQHYKDIVDLENRKYQICLQQELIGREEKSKRDLSICYTLSTQLHNSLNEARETAETRKDEMVRQIKSLIPELNKKTETLLKELENEEYLVIDPDENYRRDESDYEQDLQKKKENLQRRAEDRRARRVLHKQSSLARVDRNQAFCESLVEEKGNIQTYQQTLDMGEIAQFMNVDDAKRLHLYRFKLWHALEDWQNYTESWISQPFNAINIKEISALAESFTKTAVMCERNLPGDSSAVKELKMLVASFRETMPIVQSLGSEDLCDHHWEEIRQVAHIPEDFPIEEKTYTLGELIKLDISTYQEEICLVQITATQEAKLFKQLTETKEIVRDEQFDVQKYQKDDQYILSGIDKTQNLLDEQLTNLSNIQGSRYVKRLSGEVNSLHEQLIIASDTLEQWKRCQRSWIYLDKIFQSADICTNCKEDHKSFENMNRNWIKLMKKVYTMRFVIPNCVLESKNEQGVRTFTTSRMKEFMRWNSQLDAIEKNLADYLDAKRRDFPRFYFISNDELLELLSNQAKLELMQTYLGNLFEGMAKFNLDQNRDISAVESRESELLQFRRQIKIRNDQYLLMWPNLVDEMVKTIKRDVKESFTKLQNETKDVGDFVLEHLGQTTSIVLLASWTMETENAFEELEAEDMNPLALEEHLLDMRKQLSTFVSLIQGSRLDKIKRQIMVALISQEMHCRDTIEELVNQKVMSPHDFAWQKQLRYYFDEDAIVVKQVNSLLQYGYEYLGATTRIVITPLTDRCWLTITGALHIKLGAQPSGPAGTGKTESTKDLAKALGMLCVVYNCTDQVSYIIMGRLFSGVAQSGSWICLDEFNRIDIEVLSVIAQMLQDIKQAKLLNKEEFDFNGSEGVKLRDSCGIFVTMNPGYAGRTELPDNLKVLFRPVSMMIPSYGLIARVMLFAEGFHEAQVLSEKMVQLYQLSSQQLSQQDHYDFGLRAVKSVLVMAGQLKRASPEISEDVLLIRAMRDANIPKFLSDDVPLFNALVQDLFPGVVIEESKFEVLENQICQSIDHLRYQPVPDFTLKVTQLFDTFQVRFGVMLVGPTGGGKTVCYQVLQHAMSRLQIHQKSDPRFAHVTAKVLNPKSISMGELYGEENIDTKEWTDGLASKIIRRYAKKEGFGETADGQGNLQYWTVFDGPVDAKWIENMNTVLDDNMLLSLPNGERVKLHLAMHMLFEVEDMTQASPATVSRLGMVYMTPGDLGWIPYLDTWIRVYVMNDAQDEPAGNKRSAKAARGTAGPSQALLSTEQISYLRELIVSVVSQAFEKMERVLVEEQQLPCVPVQFVRNLCNFMEGYIVAGCRLTKMTVKPEWQRHLNFIVGYSFIWSFGGNFKLSASRFLDNMMRDFFSSLHIPENDTVFDYKFNDKTLKFEHWKTMLDPFVYESVKVPFFKLVVPTIDTMRYSAVLDHLTRMNKPVYFTGSTGTGKSMIIKNYIDANRELLNISPIDLNFSAQTSSTETQKMLEGKLEKKRKGVVGASGNSKCFIFIDDINMPTKEIYGAQPPIELLRQLLDKGGFYDRPEFFWKRLDKFTFVAAAAPPGGGRTSLSTRFMRHFHIFNLPDPTEETLTKIFESILGNFLDKAHFPEAIRRSFPSPTVAATIDLYEQITKTLLPIPSKFHYTFNLRDVAKVFQGILMTKPASVQDTDTFVRLWLHEATRVFGDRLCTTEDKQYFNDLVCEILGHKFKVRWNDPAELFGYEKDVVFTVITNINKDPDGRNYVHVETRQPIVKILEEKLYDYNVESQNKMDLVFFEDAILYVNKITRILLQPRGNAMLMGVAGCGKQSLTRLASFMLEQVFFTPQLKKDYTSSDFRENVKERLLTAGCEAAKTTFLLTDTQIVNESFLEDVNNLLNTGEITGLYQKEDLDAIEEAIGEVLTKRKLPVTKDTMKQEYTERLRDNFHIMLAMSPIGSILRERTLKFPSMVTCATLVWFDSWPMEALSDVAYQYMNRLDESQLSKEEKDKLAILLPLVHKSVESAVEGFFNELRRRTYVTPKSYLDGIQLYLRHLQETRDKHDFLVARLRTGVRNLHSTNEQINVLQGKLTDLIPDLQQKNLVAGEQAGRIQLSKQEARIQEDEARTEASRLQMEAAGLERQKLAVAAELKKAEEPMLRANEIIKKLDKADITEMKGYRDVKNPGMVATMKALLAYFGVPYSKLKETDALLKVFQKELVGDINFLNRIIAYDKDNIKHDVMVKVKELVKAKEWDVESIAKSSKAAGGLARWAEAIFEYHDRLQKVKPLQQKVADTEADFNQKQAAYQAKQRLKEEIEKRLVQMERQYEETMAYVGQLQRDKDLCEQRLTNAGKLIELLAEEGVRWEAQVKEMDHDAQFYIGSVFIAAASLSYLGPFTGKYRRSLQASWIQSCEEYGVKVSPGYTLVKTLGDPVEIRDWHMSGLPSDAVSTESGIIVQKSARWPLIIDPQMQANNWLKKMYGIKSGAIPATPDPTMSRRQQQTAMDNAFVVIQATRGVALSSNAPGGKSRDTQKVLEAAIMHGKTVLLEDVDSALDPSLDNLFAKSIYIEDGIEKINFGERAVAYDREFNFFLSTKLANPHYLPEICIKLSVVNFTVTPLGLQDQLLVDVVNNQAPHVERQRDSLIIEIGTAKNKIAEFQSKILTELAGSDSSTILDNVVLIENLEVAREAGIKIAHSLARAEQVEKKINITRNHYRDVSVRGSILYFAIVDMSGIDPMYQNSLQYVKKLFNEAIESCGKGAKRGDLSFQSSRPSVVSMSSAEGEGGSKAQIVTELTDAITKQLYGSICMGLFERHKMIYSFIICASIQRHSGEINEVHWNLLLRGAGIFNKADQPTRPKSVERFISDAEWDLIYSLQMEHTVVEPESDGPPKQKTEEAEPEEHEFSSFCDKVQTNAKEWEKYATDLDDEKTYFDHMPMDLSQTLTPFEKLLIVKIFKPQKLMDAVQKYIGQTLGVYFETGPVTSMEDLFERADSITPVIFVLSQGVDSSFLIVKYAERMSQALTSTSLGQGQDKLASKLIQEGQAEGHWVLLQNCHLFKSWMSTLEVHCGSLSERQEEIHPNFRLILTSMPADYFPPSVLQSGLKMTTEPPRGLKANLKKSYLNVVTQEMLTEGLHSDLSTTQSDRKQGPWIRLVFSLCFFHAVVQERKKFGPLGWNIRYEFSEADLDTSITMLRNFLVENDDIPWAALKFMTGEITYGGRVTDDWDRILLMNTLSHYYNENAIGSTSQYLLSESGDYYVPGMNNINDIRSYIDSLPPKEDTGIFGMHPNSEIAYMRAESQSILDLVLSVQPRVQKSTSGDEKSGDEQLLDLVAELQGNVPDPIFKENFAKEILRLNNRGLLHCHSTVLLQEVQRYNALIDRINETLENLTKAVRGLVLMSTDLDQMQSQLLNNQVPELWKQIAYPSLKPLSSWINDMCARVKFMYNWAHKGHPSTFWLSGFFFPHGFLTGTLQTYARKRSKPIDTLSFNFHLLQQTKAEEVWDAPEDGIYIYGLYIQGAKWSPKDQLLVEPEPGEMFAQMPIIHFIPEENIPAAPASPRKEITFNQEESEEAEVEKMYSCPVYKTSERAGTLSTTGQSTNFILAVSLPCAYDYQEEDNTVGEISKTNSKTDNTAIEYLSREPKHWTLRGTAMLTMLDF